MPHGQLIFAMTTEPPNSVATHRTGLVLAISALLAALVFAIHFGWRERQTTLTLRHDAHIDEEVRAFINDSLRSVSADSTDTRLRDWVDQAGMRLEYAPPTNPLVAAGVRVELARIELASGRIDRAQQYVNQAGRILDPLGDFARRARIEAALLSLNIRAHDGIDDEAVASASELLTLARQQLGPQDELTYEVNNLLGNLLLRQNQFEAAIDQLEQTLNAPAAALPADHRQRELGYALIARALRGKGDLKSALTVLDKLEKTVSSRYGAEHPEALQIVDDLALALQENGELDRALALMNRALTTRVRTLGANHRDTLSTIFNRAGLLVDMQRGDQAETELRLLLATITRDGRKDHPLHAPTLNALAAALIRLDRLDEAVPLYRESLAITMQSKGDADAAFDTRMLLIGLLTRKNDLSEAEKEYVALLDALSERFDAQDPRVLLVANDYGECLMRLRRFDEAEPLLLKTQAALAKALGQGHERVLKARARLAELYDAMQLPERAQPWRMPAATAN